MSKLFYTIPSPVPDDWRLTIVLTSFARTGGKVLPFSQNHPYSAAHCLRRIIEESGPLKLSGQEVRSPVWLDSTFLLSARDISFSWGRQTDLILGKDDRFVVLQKMHAAPTKEAIYLLGQVITAERQNSSAPLSSDQVHLLELRSDDYQKMNQDILEHLADDFGLLGLSLDCSTFPFVLPIVGQE